MARTRVKKRKTAPAPDKGPGAVPVRKLRDDPDFHSAKRVVKTADGHEVRAIDSGRSFGSYKSKTQAENRLRSIEKASPVSKTKRKKAEGDTNATDETRVSSPESPPHVHTVTVNGKPLTTTKNSGDPHSHRVMVGGKMATLSTSKEGKGHTHILAIEGTKVTTSGPRAEKKPAGEKKDAKKAETNVPRVLTFDAVLAGEMPESGSGLPSSLEADVPPRFRFWKCEDPEDARRVRDALVESCLFTDESIRKVNDEPRRVIREVVEKFYLPNYEDGEGPRVPTDARPIIRASAFLSTPDHGSEGDTVLLDKDVVGTFGIAAVIEKAQTMDGDFLIASEDNSQARLAMKAIGGAYRLKTIPGVVFASSAGFIPTDVVELVTPSREDELIEKALTDDEVRIVIKAEEERIIYGVVLEPDTVDKQNDTISAEEIRSAAHKFMEDHGVLGLQHREAINGQVKLLETFIAPTTFKAGGDEIRKGSWVLSERVVSDELWKKVKKGEITGFSIGGDAVRKPVK